MSTVFKMIGVVGITAILSACGGSDGASMDSPLIVPKDDIKPVDISAGFVPFKQQTLLESLGSLLGLGANDNANVLDAKYNKALGHMISEALGDFPITRTAKVVDLYKQGKNAFTAANSLCTTKTTVGTVTKLELKDPNTTCTTNSLWTFKAGTITMSVQGNTTTIEFNKTLYNPLDLNADNDFLVNGKIQYTETTSPSTYTYTVKSPLTFQKVLKNDPLKSVEFLGLEEYYFSINKETNQVLTSQGNIIGQPNGENFSYNFNFITTKPFVKEGINVYPNIGGKLEIVDRYNQKITIEQTADKASTASVTFNNKTPVNISWSDIVKNVN